MLRIPDLRLESWWPICCDVRKFVAPPVKNRVAYKNMRIQSGRSWWTLTGRLQT